MPEKPEKFCENPIEMRENTRKSDWRQRAKHRANAEFRSVVGNLAGLISWKTMKNQGKLLEKRVFFRHSLCVSSLSIRKMSPSRNGPEFDSTEPRSDWVYEEDEEVPADKEDGSEWGMLAGSGNIFIWKFKEKINNSNPGLRSRPKRRHLPDVAIENGREL